MPRKSAKTNPSKPRGTRPANTRPTPEPRPEPPALYREVKCIGIAVVGILLLLSVLWPGGDEPGIMGRLGGLIHSFLLGIFGFGGFLLPLLLIAGAVGILLSRRIKLPWIMSTVLFWALLALLHIINRPEPVEGMTAFARLGQVYSGEMGAYRFGGGIFGLLLGDMLYFIIGRIGSIIALSAAILILLVLLTRRSFIYLVMRGSYGVRDAYVRRQERLAAEREAEEEYRETVRVSAKEKPLPFLEFDEDEEAEYDDSPEVLLVQEDLDEMTRPKPPAFVKNRKRADIFAPRVPAEPTPPRKTGEIVLFPEKAVAEIMPEPEEEMPDYDIPDEIEDFDDAEALDETEMFDEEITFRGMVDGAERGETLPWDDDEADDLDEPPFVPVKPKNVVDLPLPVIRTDTAARETAPTPAYENYEMPSIELLTENKAPETALETRTQVLKNSRILEESLKSFKVEAKVVAVSVGPTVTRYDLAPGPGVKVSAISNLSNDLALSLAAQGIRIEAPIPGKSAVGIEIPNKEPQPVFLREILEDERFINFPSHLAFAVGKDIAGDPVVADIARMPHLLIAGATGSGKSVCINTLITSILYMARPDEVKLLMIDPKVVELSVYNGIPHLLIPVVTEPKKASGALSWAVAEMDNRYNMFAETGCRELKGYNRHLAERGEKPLPQIVIIIDELADLMMVAKGEVEESICRLAQKARAAGIHLIVATQRPSVDVITGLIKANIPSRLAFAVSSGTDSRTVLDMYGAEKLLGKGDMLFLPMGQNKPIRVQGCFISDKEVESVVGFLRAQAPADHSPEMIEHVTSPAARLAANGSGDLDEFFHDAVEFLLTKGKASTSVLQRQFRIGYNRASRLMEELEKRGIVGPEDGVKPRKVTITRSEYQEVYGNR